MKEKNMGEDILNSAEKVAIVLTQDWCPQWLSMQRWLPTIEGTDVRVYYLCYNKKQFFNEFLRVKEGHFNNNKIPYVRYYKNGKFIDDSNAVDKELFLGILV